MKSTRPSLQPPTYKACAGLPDLKPGKRDVAFLWSATHWNALGGAKPYPEQVEGTLRPKRSGLPKAWVDAQAEQSRPSDASATKSPRVIHEGHPDP